MPKPTEVAVLVAKFKTIRTLNNTMAAAVSTHVMLENFVR